MAENFPVFLYSNVKIFFGLSTARVGATLARVLVGYNIIIGETSAGEPIRLLNGRRVEWYHFNDPCHLHF